MAMVAESSIPRLSVEFILQVGGGAIGAPKIIQLILVGLREGETTATGTTTAGMHGAIGALATQTLGPITSARRVQLQIRGT